MQTLTLRIRSTFRMQMKFSNLLEQAGMPVLLDASGRDQVGACGEDVADYDFT